MTGTVCMYNIYDKLGVYLKTQKSVIGSWCIEDRHSCIEDTHKCIERHDKHSCICLKTGTSVCKRQKRRCRYLVDTDDMRRCRYLVDTDDATHARERESACKRHRRYGTRKSACKRHTRCKSACKGHTRQECMQETHEVQDISNVLSRAIFLPSHKITATATCYVVRWQKDSRW